MKDMAVKEVEESLKMELLFEQFEKENEQFDKEAKRLGLKFYPLLDFKCNACGFTWQGNGWFVPQKLLQNLQLRYDSEPHRLEMAPIVCPNVICKCKRMVKD